jgi:hypothetical protein
VGGGREAEKSNIRGKYLQTEDGEDYMDGDKEVATDGMDGLEMKR